MDQIRLREHLAEQGPWTPPGHKIGPDTLSDIISAKCSFFDKHIHLNAVTEGFVGNKSGNLRGGDDIVFSRLDAYCSQIVI